MTATNPSLKHEVNDLVLEQIHTLKQPTDLTEPELLEYHLRYQRIMTLYQELERSRLTGRQ